MTAQAPNLSDLQLHPALTLFAWGEPQTARTFGGFYWTAFAPGQERYHFDFADGFLHPWEQYDTSSDAWYYGIWVNMTQRMILNLAEGDLSLALYDDMEALAGALETLEEVHGPAPAAFTVIATDGTVSKVFCDRPAVEE